MAEDFGLLFDFKFYFYKSIVSPKSVKIQKKITTKWKFGREVFNILRNHHKTIPTHIRWEMPKIYNGSFWPKYPDYSFVPNCLIVGVGGGGRIKWTRGGGDYQDFL